MPADAVPQTLTVEPFDEASEFGVPKGVAPPPDVLKVGYTFKDYDKASGSRGVSCEMQVPNRSGP